MRSVPKASLPITMTAMNVRPARPACRWHRRSRLLVAGTKARALKHADPGTVVGAREELPAAQRLPLTKTVG